MQFDSIGDGEDGEHKCIGFVALSNKFMKSFEQNHLTDLVHLTMNWTSSASHSYWMNISLAVLTNKSCSSGDRFFLADYFSMTGILCIDHLKHSTWIPRWLQQKWNSNNWHNFVINDAKITSEMSVHMFVSLQNAFLASIVIRILFIMWVWGKYTHFPLRRRRWWWTLL